MCRCVWSINLVNEEAMARVGPQRHKKKIMQKEMISRKFNWDEKKGWEFFSNLIMGNKLLIRACIEIWYPY